MKQPFSIIQLRIHLQALYGDAISFSKLVEILNQTAEDNTRHQWVSFKDEQPLPGESVIVQYKTFEFDNIQYDPIAADFYKENCLHWLNQKSKQPAVPALCNCGMKHESCDCIELNQCTECGGKLR